MLALMARLFKHPHDVLTIFQDLVKNPASNDEQRDKLASSLDIANLNPAATYDPLNPLFDSAVSQYLMEHPEQQQAFEALMRYQLTHLIKSN